MHDPTTTFDDRLARRNAIVLALTQALGGANNSLLFATGGIVGAMLAPDKSLATLPLSLFVLGLWIGTLPMGALVRQFGRRSAFQIGTLCGVVTGVFSFGGVVLGSFLLFSAGAFFSGLYSSGIQSYRFAAADTASPAFRPKAISWVLAGGVAAGILGPQVVIYTKDLWPPFLFAPTFLAQSVMGLAALVVLFALRIPRIDHGEAVGPVRPLREIALQPRFIVAVVCGVASYAMMNFLMTSAPLAMLDCGLTVTDAALGLQWHVIAMYLPSFVTGSLIARFGIGWIIAVGLAFILASALVGLSGTTLWHFWGGLVLLGAGWNLGFIGATTMVTECHTAAERTVVQPLNDFLVFGSMTVGSFSSGFLVAHAGWGTVNAVVIPIVLASIALLAFQALGQRRETV